MKFLLTAVNAKYIHSNPAVYGLRAYAGEKYCDMVEIAEYTINQRMGDVLQDIYEHKPDVIGFSCYIWNWTMIKELLGELPKILPGMPIWLGGPEVSFESYDMMQQLPMVTGIMKGEGEKTFRELLAFYAEETHGLGEIDGIIYRENGHITETSPKNLMDMNSLPFLYRESDDFEHRIIYYESSRGCPFRCSYCLSAIDKAVRVKEAGTVCQELEYFLERKVAQVKFIDRTFNCRHEHAEMIWNYILEKDNGVTGYHFEIAGDILTDDQLRILSCMRAGLVQLEIGVQSTNEKTLLEINRRTDMEKLSANIKRLHQGRNIHLHLDLIAGLPFEDFDRFTQSFNEVYAMNPDQLQLGFLKVLKGSPLHDKAKEYGIRSLEQPPYEVLHTNWISYGEICRLKIVEEMVEQYYNSGQFVNTLAVLSDVFSSPFEMYDKLGDYYKEKGYLTNSPSRIYRYHILLDFACAYDESRDELYRELLTYDVYLREKIKSRPSFARETKMHDEERREFFESKEMIRKYLPDYESLPGREISRMAQFEFFHYPVFDLDAVRKRGRRDLPYKVLFDYQKRNVLSREAAVIVIGEADG